MSYRLERIDVTLGGRRVLVGADLHLSPGETVVLIGPNGAGKSSCLKAMTGELRPAAGRVTLDGTDIAAMSAAELAARRAVLAQSAATSFPFSALEIVRIGAEAGGARAARRDAVARDALARVGLARYAGRLMQALSGGEAQRVHLARALAQLAAASERGNRPLYLFLDEPTASLDLEHQLLALDIARDFAARGHGVLAVLHDLNLAAMAADRLLALKQGRILAAGAPQDVLTDALLDDLYRVPARVSATPECRTPFVLPQTARSRPHHALGNRPERGRL